MAGMQSSGGAQAEEPRQGAAASAAPPPFWPGWLRAGAICIRFYSRLPVPALPGEADRHALPDFRLVPRAVPLAALVIALPAALILLGSGAAGVHPMLAAGLAIAALVVTTGAFHEDGLGDSADGLFGGHSAERRLEIMKDSRVGSFGAVAIALALLLRIAGLASILGAAGPVAAAGCLLLAAAWSRAEGVGLLAREPAARSGGASAAVGRPLRRTAWIGFVLAAALALTITLATGLPLAALALALALCHAAARGLAALARRMIGGQTGDIVGAVQQIGEIAIYCGFALVLGGARP